MALSRAIGRQVGLQGKPRRGLSSRSAEGAQRSVPLTSWRPVPLPRAWALSAAPLANPLCAESRTSHEADGIAGCAPTPGSSAPRQRYASAAGRSNASNQAFMELAGQLSNLVAGSNPSLEPRPGSGQ